MTRNSPERIMISHIISHWSFVSLMVPMAMTLMISTQSDLTFIAYQVACCSVLLNVIVTQRLSNRSNSALHIVTVVQNKLTIILLILLLQSVNPEMMVFTAILLGCVHSLISSSMNDISERLYRCISISERESLASTLFVGVTLGVTAGIILGKLCAVVALKVGTVGPEHLYPIAFAIGFIDLVLTFRICNHADKLP